MFCYVETIYLEKRTFNIAFLSETMKRSNPKLANICHTLSFPTKNSNDAYHPNRTIQNILLTHCNQIKNTYSFLSRTREHSISQFIHILQSHSSSIHLQPTILLHQTFKTERFSLFSIQILEYDTHTSVLHKTSFISDNHHRNRQRHVPFPTYKHLLTNICE